MTDQGRNVINMPGKRADIPSRAQCIHAAQEAFAGIEIKGVDAGKVGAILWAVYGTVMLAAEGKADFTSRFPQNTKNGLRAIKRAIAENPDAAHQLSRSLKGWSDCPYDSLEKMVDDKIAYLDIVEEHLQEAMLRAGFNLGNGRPKDAKAVVTLRIWDIIRTRIAMRAAARGLARCYVSLGIFREDESWMAESLYQTIRNHEQAR